MGLLFILTALVIHLMMRDDAILVAGDAILRYSGHTYCLAKQTHLFTALSTILFTMLIIVLLIHCSLTN